MTQLNELINKHIDSIKFNGCQLSTHMLQIMFDNIVAIAKHQEAIESNQRYLDSLPTAFGHGGNDQVNTIGQHITEPEFIQPNEMVKGKWYKAYLLVTNSFWIFKFVDISNNKVNSKESVNIESGNAYNGYSVLSMLENISQIRTATIEEVTKYFPNEFDSNVTEHPNKY